MFKSLIEYLDSIVARDPAPRSRWEVLLYPGLWAVGWHRIAHWLFEARMFFLARLINHMSRFFTAIDIHPGATIGRHLFIDHGFTVIGETAEIGNNVTIYQCVTLGGTKPFNGVGGKRHPTLEDNVIVGSGAQILGPIGVGAARGEAELIRGPVISVAQQRRQRAAPGRPGGRGSQASARAFEATVSVFFRSVSWATGRRTPDSAAP